MIHSKNEIRQGLSPFSVSTHLAIERFLHAPFLHNIILCLFAERGSLFYNRFSGKVETHGFTSCIEIGLEVNRSSRFLSFIKTPVPTL